VLAPLSEGISCIHTRKTYTSDQFWQRRVAVFQKNSNIYLRGSGCAMQQGNTPGYVRLIDRQKVISNTIAAPVKLFPLYQRKQLENALVIEFI